MALVVCRFCGVVFELAGLRVFGCGLGVWVIVVFLCGDVESWFFLGCAFVLVVLVAL